MQVDEYLGITSDARKNVTDRKISFVGMPGSWCSENIFQVVVIFDQDLMLSIMSLIKETNNIDQKIVNTFFIFSFLIFLLV
jgi:hypothetical protein